MPEGSIYLHCVRCNSWFNDSVEIWMKSRNQGPSIVLYKQFSWFLVEMTTIITIMMINPAKQSTADSAALSSDDDHHYHPHCPHDHPTCKAIRSSKWWRIRGGAAGGQERRTSLHRIFFLRKLVIQMIWTRHKEGRHLKIHLYIYCIFSGTCEDPRALQDRQ